MSSSTNWRRRAVQFLSYMTYVTTLKLILIMLSLYLYSRVCLKTIQYLEDKSCYIVNLKTDDKSINWKIRLEKSEINQLRTKAKKLNNLIFICTDYNF